MSTLSRSWRSFLQRTHAGDYLGLIILAAANSLLFINQEPFHRMFSLDDRHLAFPHAEHERVPVPMLLILSILIPLGTIIAWGMILQRGAGFVQVSVLGLSTSLLLTNFLTDMVKNYVGSPRPDLISRCIPKADTPLHELVTFEVSFAGLFYLSLFLSGQLHIFHHGADLTRVCMALSPTILAGMIAMSRLEDYRHDYYDVSAGALVGVLTAYYAYRRYFPKLTSAECEVPYAEVTGAGYEGIKEADLEMGEMSGA